MTSPDRINSWSDGRFVFLSLVIPFVVLLFHSAEASTILVHREDHGKEVTVKVGTLIRMELEEIGGTGYLWDFEVLNPEYFEILKVETTEPVEGKSGAGFPIMKAWLLRAKREGKVELKMRYHRPWEGKERAIDRFRVLFSIEQ